MIKMMVCNRGHLPYTMEQGNTLRLSVGTWNDNPKDKVWYSTGPFEKIVTPILHGELYVDTEHPLKGELKLFDRCKELIATLPIRLEANGRKIASVEDKN